MVSLFSNFHCTENFPLGVNANMMAEYEELARHPRPVLILQGEWDKTIKLEQTTKLYNLFRQHRAETNDGAQVQLKVYDDGHYLPYRKAGVVVRDFLDFLDSQRD